MARYLNSLFVICVLGISVCQGAQQVIDVQSDLKDAWSASCSGGYHSLETFVCDQGPLIPVVDHTGNQGFWTKCSSGFVPFCNIFYNPVGVISWKQILFDAYYSGNAVITVVIESNSGYTTQLLNGQPGWQTTYVDIASYTGIKEIKISLEYHGLQSFVLIDKIILDDVQASTTTTTPRPSTTRPPASTTGSTGATGTAASTTAAATTTRATTAAPTTAASTTAAPSTAAPTTSALPPTTSA